MAFERPAAGDPNRRVRTFGDVEDLLVGRGPGPLDAPAGRMVAVVAGDGEPGEARGGGGGEGPGRTSNQGRHRQDGEPGEPAGLRLIRCPSVDLPQPA